MSQIDSLLYTLSLVLILHPLLNKFFYFLKIYNHQILDHYFKVLRGALKQSDFSGDEIEKDWRPLYHIAWADFHRFLKGWSPGHWKINSYSERVTKQVIENLN